METQGCGVCMTHVGTYAHTYTYTYMAAPVFSINRAVLDDTDAAASESNSTSAKSNIGKAEVIYCANLVKLSVSVHASCWSMNKPFHSKFEQFIWPLMKMDVII